MLYRMTTIFVLICSAALLLGGCGGGGNVSLEAAGSVATGSDAPAQAITAADLETGGKTPLFVSSHGPSLYMLEAGHGLPVDADLSQYSVEETVLDSGDIEWRIIDASGIPRPVFVRVAITTPGSGYLPVSGRVV